MGHSSLEVTLLEWSHFPPDKDEIQLGGDTDYNSSGHNSPQLAPIRVHIHANDWPAFAQ